jgi:methionyl-tRNA formyltransferase
LQEESLIRVYFLGSGDEGIPVLRRLLDAPGIDVVGIGTQPDRPAGRKRALRPTPIAEFAESYKFIAETAICEHLLSA